MNLACHTKVLQIYSVVLQGIFLISIPQNNTPALQRIKVQKSSVTLLRYNFIFSFFLSLLLYPNATWHAYKFHQTRRLDVEYPSPWPLFPTPIQHLHAINVRNVTQLQLNKSIKDSCISQNLCAWCFAFAHSSILSKDLVQKSFLEKNFPMS